MLTKVGLGRLRRRALRLLASAFGCAAVAATPAAALVLPRAKPEDVGFNAERLKRLDEHMQSMVTNGQVAGAVTLLARHGRVVHTKAFGQRVLGGPPMPVNAIFRIRSETKPVTGVAMMILYEQGLWKLDDPITKHVPEFANLRIAAGVDAEGKPVLAPISRPPTMRELMTHTAGFAYGIADDPSSPADQAYYQAGVLQSASLEDMAAKISDLPMFSEPGQLWRYSVAADIQGYIVEKLSGQSLPDFMQQRIFAPLKMRDTGFYVPQQKLPRLAAIYDGDPVTGKLVPAVEGAWRDVSKLPAAPSGGGGLVSTAGDFARFAQMILNKGSLEGVRILKPETVALMTRNHLPPGFVVTTNGTTGVLKPGPRPFPFAAGMGYGIDLAVAVDPAASGAPVGPGTVSWGGSAGTWFWIDPTNDLFFIGMIQRLGGVGGGLDAQSRTLVYQAIERPPAPATAPVVQPSKPAVTTQPARPPATGQQPVKPSGPSKPAGTR
ncbi:serine hydrolase [Caulobacter sp. RHG1]|uniref:serine hydrolase domain-containing protein n=1 Tax=Caulobacter sp. (strain RHG1) TaxID=2545762 RepID=UPI001554378D|nr:serine hydrolase domain-containing protein [Caulobacter sp. RHG1]NQE64984.1 Beta-lactamase class C-like and penicillin binding proteins (PBPs) superfamily [Caulobacter sp. RHG1]